FFPERQSGIEFSALRFVRNPEIEKTDVLKNVGNQVIVQKVERTETVLVLLPRNVLRMRDVFGSENRRSGHESIVVIDVEMTDVFRKKPVQPLDFFERMYGRHVVFLLEVRNQDVAPERSKIVVFAYFQPIIQTAADALPAVFRKLIRL